MAPNRSEIKIILKSKFRNSLRFQLASALWLFGALAGLAQQVAPVPAGTEILTNAAAVISLSAEQAARRLHVTVTGIVTAADPALKGRFFVADSTAGVFVDNAGGARREPGDVVEISGITDAGAYAPIITAPHVRRIGTAPLPQAAPVSIDRLMSGAEDSQRIEISGLVRVARVEGSRLTAELVSGGFRFRVYAPVAPGTDAQALVAAEVRVRGTAAEAHNRSLRQLVAVEVYVPSASDFIVEKPAALISRPVPLNSLAQYRRDNSFNQRIVVNGVVTLQRAGEDLFLQDLTGGLQIKGPHLAKCLPGQVIEAVGFLSFENFLPVLQDAVVRKSKQPPMVISPKAASFEDLQNGLHHADFVSINGKLLDCTVRQGRNAINGPASTRTTLVLETENALFTAEADEAKGDEQLASIPIGSTLAISGICLMEIDLEGKVKSFRLLIGGPKDVVVVAKPSWFTPQRLLIGLASVSLILVLAVAWSIMVSRRNSVLNLLIREREQAQKALQEAHDLLDHRVKERTAELKFQITARKESEVQSKAVLSERTRLAQELHDTVEQTLTGIALQLDTAAKLYDQNPADAQHHFALARKFMAKSQVELRRSVWDLRCRALEQFDLSNALLSSARQITYGTNIQVKLETKGQPQALTEVVEENLLRIGQEALTNIIKHSSATLVTIELAFNCERVALQIQDNGCGFDQKSALGPGEGHFGLLGMSERTKRLGGQLRLTSAPDHGSTIWVEIPLKPAAETPLSNVTELP